jgi:hypothetical protein
MNIKYTSTVNTPMRLALIGFAQSVFPQPSHMLTLNFHDDYLIDTATARIRTWYQFMMRRLFGRNWKSASDGLGFVLFPEYSRAGHIHYHGPMLLAERHSNYFSRIAADRWKRITPTGSFHCQPTNHVRDGFSEMYRYMTKSSSANQLLHSSMLRE